jgi:membrane associated rhomboid family serine protease
MYKDLKEYIFTIKYPLLLIAFIWLVEIVDRAFLLDIESLGILPRTGVGFLHIVTAPFVHGEWNHLYNNSFSLLATTAIMATFYPKVAFNVFITIMILTGIGVWLYARDAYHIGASGVIYGLVSYIFWTGIFKKNAKSVVLALLVLSLYAGMFESIFPNVEKDISWESHLAGAIAGIIVAFIFKNVVEEDELQYKNKPWALEDNKRQYFLPRDIFEKTKHQRYLEWLESERLRQEQIERYRRIAMGLDPDGI